MMLGAFLLVATCLVGALGFALIAFSQQQHWLLLRRSDQGQRPSWLRPAGWIALGFSAIPALMRDGFAFGLLLWSVMLTISALVVTGLLVNLNRRDKNLGMRPDYGPKNEPGNLSR